MSDQAIKKHDIVIISAGPTSGESSRPGRMREESRLHGSRPTILRASNTP